MLAPLYLTTCRVLVECAYLCLIQTFRKRSPESVCIINHHKLLGIPAPVQFVRREFIGEISCYRPTDGIWTEQNSTAQRVIDTAKCAHDRITFLFVHWDLPSDIIQFCVFAYLFRRLNCNKSLEAPIFIYRLSVYIRQPFVCYWLLTIPGHSEPHKCIDIAHNSPPHKLRPKRPHKNPKTGDLYWEWGGSPNEVRPPGDEF